ncbi:MAG: ECF transporter S component [Eubacteriales bacterium]
MTNTNTSSKTRKLVTLSLLTAITFILGFTPIGYIHITPTFAITLLHIPVIIGVVAEGFGAGLVLALIFGLTSILQIPAGLSPLGAYLYNLGPLRTIIIIFIPRLIIPVTAYLTHSLLQKSRKGVVNKSTYVVTALVGSLTNTFFFLGFMYMLFLPEIEQVALAFEATTDTLLKVLGAIVISNGIPEAIAAMIIVPLVCVPLAITSNKKRKGTVDDSDI